MHRTSLYTLTYHTQHYGLPGRTWYTKNETQ